MNIRKVARYLINALALIIGISAMPEFGALVPTAWLPGIASVVAVINTILSLIRQIGAGEPLLLKEF